MGAKVFALPKVVARVGADPNVGSLFTLTTTVFEALTPKESVTVTTTLYVPSPN